MNNKKVIIVSACLAGFKCNYKAESKTNLKVVKLVREGKAIPLCPEQLGGLTTPRIPSERVGNKVLDKKGRDVTRQFEKGADLVSKICLITGCKKAILKSKSPSCGVGKIYDGTFTNTLTKGDGITAEKLRKIGIKLITEKDL